jgi:predicted nucleic acid-binding protein
MTIVVDASVVLKWLLNDPERESHTEQATQLMQRIANGEERVVQPAHWLLEVGAVLTRISPHSVEEDVLMLEALELPSEKGAHVLQHACRLAVDLKQDLFDTLYHAVALELPDAVFVTADEKYLGQSRHLGRIVALGEWRP